MLGTLAKWLRILGFDTFYANSEIDDKKLLEIARKEDRTLVTRDKELMMNSRRENLRVVEINTVDLDEQLKLVLKNVEIDKTRFLSRCTICNSEIIEMDKEKVKSFVPKKVFENNKNFWYCKKCDKYYWTGSHSDKMLEKIKGLQKTN